MIVEERGRHPTVLRRNGFLPVTEPETTIHGLYPLVVAPGADQQARYNGVDLLMTPSSYVFRNEDQSILTLNSIGWQRIVDENYSFSSEDRPDCGHVIFQYMLKP